MTPAATLVVTSHELRRGLFTNSPVAREWWGTLDGTPVAYMKTLTYADTRQTGATFVLCDIEVRPEYQGRGLSRALLTAAEAQTNDTLHTSGHYTPKGERALRGRVPVLPGQESGEGVRFDDMTFVRDWDGQIGPS